MDPTATLAAIRAAIAEGDDALALDLFQELDEWLSRGGFNPEQWDVKEL